MLFSLRNATYVLHIGTSHQYSTSRILLYYRVAELSYEIKFAIGDKLPNENELSVELQVSRTTLREAIRILAAHNVLKIQRGKGTYVKNNQALNINQLRRQLITSL